jgi:hypothetical protein
MKIAQWPVSRPFNEEVHPQNAFVAGSFAHNYF